MDFELVVNGRKRSIPDVPGHASLLNVLRDRLGLLGAKEGCGVGECGACTVLLDGKPVNACLTLAAKAAGREITTVEGLAPEGEVHPLQES